MFLLKIRRVKWQKTLKLALIGNAFSELFTKLEIS